MTETAPGDSSSHTFKPAAPLKTGLGWLMAILAGVSFLFVLWALVSPEQSPGKDAWPEAVLLMAVAVATMVSLSRQLPVQNVILAAAIIALLGSFAHGVGAVTGIPFGHFQFPESTSPKILGLVAWPMPAIWVIAILNSRGVARLILQPQTKLRTYGFWLIGVTAVLTVLFAMALDPFATQVKRCWLWQPTNFPLTWHGAPLMNFGGWLFVALLVLAFATPALINKQSSTRRTPPDYHPLAVWLASLGLFATGAIVHKLWLATAFCFVTALVTGWLAVRGARWQL